ncbi:hypothetical protein D3C86_1447870 [compost metagenome]
MRWVMLMPRFWLSLTMVRGAHILNSMPAAVICLPSLAPPENWLPAKSQRNLTVTPRLAASSNSGVIARP